MRSVRHELAMSYLVFGPSLGVDLEKFKSLHFALTSLLCCSKELMNFTTTSIPSCLTSAGLL